MGYTQIRHEDLVLKELKDLQDTQEAGSKSNFEREHLIRCLDANKHNHETTCYYLLLSKMEREGKIKVDSQFITSSPHRNLTTTAKQEINVEK